MDKGLKRKQRAKVAKAKVLRRRNKIREEAKKTREAYKAERDAIRNVNRHVQTVRHGDRRLTEDEIKKQLEENMKLLEGLEQEYSGLMKSREQFAQELAAKQQAEEPASNWGGSADVEWQANPVQPEPVADKVNSPAEPEPEPAEPTVGVEV